MSSELYIGLMSGTSMDGVDCALVDLGLPYQQSLIDFITVDIPPELKSQLYTLCQQAQISLGLLGETDAAMAELFASAVLSILEKNQLNKNQIQAIGSHGQTVYHQPPGKGNHAFSLQIVDPNILCARCGITTVADFRRKDMALGGQGAPLLPVFHQHLFSSTETDRIILNIGGMANITLLRKDDPYITGFDTGPGNILMDTWIQDQQNLSFDKDGTWSASGKVNNALLEFMLEDAYFSAPYPKSTGREYFNLDWLKKQVEHYGKEVSAQDIQATLVKLTSMSISAAIKSLLNTGEVIVCGGGASNKLLMQTLAEDLAEFKVLTTEAYDVNPNALEALAFAWFAKQTLQQQPIDLTHITGSSRPVILGGVYYAE